MRSIKPGRGPSAMGAFGSLISVGFGIIWTIFAASFTADAGFPINLFPLFGVLFIVAGIGQFLFNLKNTTSENRFSSFDVVDSDNEPDPLNERFGNHHRAKPYNSQTNQADGENEFCPYCGKHIESDFEFCPKCGKTLPN